MPANVNEVHFPCPNCGLRLACEDGYGGWRIQCPACHGGVVVPLRDVPVRAATASPAALAVIAGSIRPDATAGKTSAATGESSSFAARFVEGFGMALSGLVSGVVAVLAAFGLLVGGCCSFMQSSQSRAGALDASTLLVLCVVGGMLLLFAALWERMWR